LLAAGWLALVAFCRWLTSQLDASVSCRSWYLIRANLPLPPKKKRFRAFPSQIKKTSNLNLDWY
jgi:hypothetical protein